MPIRAALLRCFLIMIREGLRISTFTIISLMRSCRISYRIWNPNFKLVPEQPIVGTEVGEVKPKGNGKVRVIALAIGTVTASKVI